MQVQVVTRRTKKDGTKEETTRTIYIRERTASQKVRRIAASSKVPHS